MRKVLLLMGLSMLGAMLFSSVALAQQTSASPSASASASASAGSTAVPISGASSVAPSASASATASASVLSETGGPPFATALALAALLALVGSGLVASRLLAHRGGS